MQENCGGFYFNPILEIC